MNEIEILKGMGASLQRAAESLERFGVIAEAAIQSTGLSDIQSQSVIRAAMSNYEATKDPREARGVAQRAADNCRAENKKRESRFGV